MSLLPSYREIVDLVKVGSTIEAQEKIMELRSAALQIEEENFTLRTRVKELEAQLTVRDELQWEKPYYWMVNGDTKDGPYCQKCYDGDQKLIRLQGGNGGVWFCHTCKGRFYDASYKPRVPTRSNTSWKIV